MAGTFGARTRELEDAIGSGNLKGTVEVNQVYAHIQHEDRTFRHPRGGQAGYLGEPLFARANRYMQHLADKAITAEGSELVQAMADNMEDLSDQVEVLAPLDYGDLRKSGHPMVEDGEDVVYDRPPKQERLTEAQLRAKQRGADYRNA